MTVNSRRSRSRCAAYASSSGEDRIANIRQAIFQAQAMKSSEDFLARSAAARAALDWSTEHQKFRALIDSLPLSTWSACLFANKPVRNNSRVANVSRSLAQMGFACDVYAHSEPEDGLRVPGVNYIVAN